MKSKICIPLIAAFTVLPVLAHADSVVCEGADVSVTASEDLLAQSVCDTVQRTITLLEQCGLQLSEPIDISILDDLPKFGDNCFGYYECDGNHISLRSPVSIANVSAQSVLYTGLDPIVILNSLVAHEVAHAAFAQSTGEDAAFLANHEYVAYAVQMWSLPPLVRDEIVASFGQDEPVEPIRLNELVAVMAPEKFAALAWQHFNEPGHGCDFVQDLATGRATLAIIWE